MRRFLSRCFIVIFFCLQTLAAAGRTETEDIRVGTAQTEDVRGGTAKDRSVVQAAESGKEAGTGKESENGETAGTSAVSEKAAEKDAAAESGKEGKKDAATELSAESGADLTFASIHNKGLTIAEENKWYYESFDRHGRSSFAVLYEGGTMLEKTVWIYKNAARYPLQKKIFRDQETEIFCYDEEGRELTIERYSGKTLTFKTENIYNSFGKLLEQTVTVGKDTDRSVWEFTGDKTLTQTKYRNGKKTAFIELHSTPHIVHLYIDDKEVYVGEEQ